MSARPAPCRTLPTPRPWRSPAPAPTRARSWPGARRDLRAGGDYPGNEFIIGSGPDALLCRYKSGRRVARPRDQITLEFAGA